MKKIALFGQFNHHFPKKYVTHLLDELEKYKTKIYIEEECAKHIEKISSKKYLTFLSHKDLNVSFNFFISIGGDGTILRAINYIRKSGIPIIGINVGKLGFLATVQKDEISAVLKKINNKEYTISERNLLALQSNTKIPNFNEEFNFALNEITISRKNTTSMITVNTQLDDEFLTSYWSDGLIISTATGSTGYSLSCGGPIITPHAKSFVLTPIAPHNLNMRPLIVPETTVVKLAVNSREETYLVSLDGRSITVKNETELIIKKAPFQIKMLIPNNNSFLKTLREKMLWGKDKRNKF